MHLNPAINCGDYRYGFNSGSERDDEIKGVGNSYSTYFRQLDTRLGRWLSLDPKATAWESPYVSMGNTPIWASDPMGDKFKKKSQKKIDKFKKQTENRLEELETDIMTNSIQLDADGYDAKIDAKIDDLIAMRNEVKTALNEVTDLENSEQVFKLKKIKFAGESRYNGLSKTVKITYDDFATLGHELKHGHQFIDGKLDFDKKNKAGGELYDLVDEQEAYRRQYALDPKQVKDGFKEYSEGSSPVIIRKITDITIKNLREAFPNTYEYIIDKVKQYSKQNLPPGYDKSKNIIFGEK